jgi:hypothetical protein
MLFTYGKGHPYTRSQGGGTKLHHLGNLSLVQDNYIGFQFSESGSLHYGWARLTVTFQKNVGKGKHTVIHVLGYGLRVHPQHRHRHGQLHRRGAIPEQHARRSVFGFRRSFILGMLALGRAVGAK